VLILSRGSGAGHELADALLVNPYEYGGTGDAIHHALAMAPEERRARIGAHARVCAREHNILPLAGTLIAELAAIE